MTKRVVFAPRDPVPDPEHLGDGAYVRPGAYHGETVLYASDGINETNHVFLEPHAVARLIEWLKRFGYKIG